MPKPPANTVDEALARDDAKTLAGLASHDELKRMKKAEEVLGLRYERKKRNARLVMLGQAMVGYVALAGFFANAYQNWNNKKQAEDRARQESERWEKEFKRAQDADKYRAFFETSALATDPANPDKRLVGYALLKEFVDDKTYSNKALIMLEESLALELRNDTADHGLDDPHRLAVVAILSALSHTQECKVLAQAARSVDKLLPQHTAKRGSTVAAGATAAVVENDADQMREVFELYVRQLVGRAATVCTNEKEFRDVRKPISALLIKLPRLGGNDAQGGAKITASEAERQLAVMLRQGCDDEQTAALYDCAEVDKGYLALCAAMVKHKDLGDDAAACEAMK